MTEDQLEQETLGWLQDVGYDHLYGPDIAHDAANPARANYQQVHLPLRLREAVNKLNPGIPTAVRDDAIKQMLDLGVPALLGANKHFHRMLVAGVPVEYQKDGETRGDFVQLIDWAVGHTRFHDANGTDGGRDFAWRVRVGPLRWTTSTTTAPEAKKPFEIKSLKKVGGAEQG